MRKGCPQPPLAIGPRPPYTQLRKVLRPEMSNRRSYKQQGTTDQGKRP